MATGKKPMSAAQLKYFGPKSPATQDKTRAVKVTVAAPKKGKK